MASDRDMLVKMARQLEDVIAGISGVADILETHTETLADLAEWLKEPPKSDLPDLLKRLTTAVELMQAQIVALPAAVTRAILDGELSGRG